MYRGTIKFVPLSTFYAHRFISVVAAWLNKFRKMRICHDII